MKRVHFLPMLAGGVISCLFFAGDVRANDAPDAAARCPDASAVMDIGAAFLPSESAAYYGDQTFPEMAREGADARAAVEAAQSLHIELMSREPGIPESRSIQIELTAQELDAIASDTIDASERRMQVGVERAVSERITFASGSMRKTGEQADIARSGDVAGVKAWGTRVSSPGATGLRLRFADVHLPSGASIYVYNAAGDAFGPYGADMVSDTGDFWSNIVGGDELRVQVEARDRSALEETSFTIADVAHIGPRFQANIRAPGEVGRKSFCAFNAPCVTNAKCIPDTYWNNIELLRRATAHYVFQSGGGSYICSGGLVNDSNPHSTVPYFLTANHCMSTSDEANSIEAFWQFTTPCGGNCFDAEGQVPSTLGASLLKTGYKQDFTFLRLKQMPPNNSVYLGWTANPVAHSQGTSLYRVSHPKGAPQAFSRHSVDRLAGTCDGLPRGFFIYSRDVRGGTEGGSSGSVVTNAQAQIVGQLLGACGFDPEKGCAPELNSTVDGAFAAYYSLVKPWLNP